jgi:hypothetical protein
MAYDGIRWHTMAYDGIRWHTVEYSGVGCSREGAKETDQANDVSFPYIVSSAVRQVCATREISALGEISAVGQHFCYWNDV